MTLDVPHGHIDLLAGANASGQAVHEQVPATLVNDAGVYELVATPALVLGCAAGDTIKLNPDRSFQILRRGGNVAIQAFSSTTFTQAEIQYLTDAFTPLHGLVEAPHHARFIVVTVPATAGFTAIEAAMADWHATTPSTEWFYSNVYADDGSPLNWWHNKTD